MQEETFEDRHGVAVLLRRWDVASPRACVVLAHGASEHSGRYGRFATALNAAGMSAYALDQRGHGGTSSATGRGRMGPGGGEALLDDLDDVIEQARRDHPDAPVALFGHSLGAVIALAHAVRRGPRLTALVLSGFPASLAATEAFRAGFQSAVDGGLADQPMDALSAFNAAFEPARTPFDWLSRDATEVDAYLADPDCGDGLPLTYGFFAELYAAVAPALRPDALPALACPVQLVTGGQDPAAANADNARELAIALRAAGVVVDEQEYADARHELLNELNRDEVTADVIDWLLRVLPTERVEEPA